jgi:hypothetical protein
MFLAGRPNEQKEYYKQHLRSLGSLSRLFSDSNKPYLYYRAAENLFCKSFGAKNHSRSDIAIDASFESIGVGLKTFINSPSTKLEKVAEFNSSSAALRKMGPEVQVLEIARLRNERLETSKTIYDLNSLIYHCVTRDKGRMAFIESPMNLIDLDSLSITSVNDKAIKFKDNNDEYSFNLSKSTLFKRFSVTEVIDSIDVQILDDPFKLLESLLVSKTTADLVFAKHAEEKNYIVLPLYSTRIDKNGQKQVQEKSALNQWNASGRARDFGEVYIHIPCLDTYTI